MYEGSKKLYKKLYRFQKVIQNFGSILIAEPLENVFSKNNFSNKTKICYFFFQGGEGNCLDNV